MAPGIHLLHKPPGPTSFTLVQACKQQTSRRLCHGGTLDPFASGLLLILVEPATRLFDYLHDIPKTYDATVVFGQETDNGDPLGTTVATGVTSHLTPTILNDALSPFIGWHDQVPPPTSAKRINGRRAYERVHAGEDVTLPPYPVYLHSAQWLSHDLPHSSRLRIVVGGGYYVRSLARHLGRTLGCRAHLGQLHRISIGPWTDPGPDRQTEIHGRDILPWAASRELTDQEVGDLKKGAVIPAGQLTPPDWNPPNNFPPPRPPIRAFHHGKFCFLLESNTDGLQMLTPLRGGL